MLRVISLLSALPLVIAVLAFTIQNSHIVTLSLWPVAGEINLPLSILSVGLFLTGMLAGFFLMWVHMLPHRFRVRRLQREVQDLNEALAEQTSAKPAFNQTFKPERPRRRWFGGSSND